MQGIGTPEQDAYRRDLTINSLFYNINTATVEDFTGRGVSDLQLCIIRTPLEPQATFIDDPLRILRAVRFAARSLSQFHLCASFASTHVYLMANLHRFRFKMDDALQQAAMDASIQVARRTYEHYRGGC